ncbi:hypothetical protein [Paraburkholderia caribensis]|uniref:hypothetical protein n=1 Tax=Paraburkholderia caribensis TaxID=75105 RepID=UPI001D097E44|nr:hypothetical protein [Paraburkholderia caribensis]
MQASQTPTLVPLAFAANGTKNTIPEASQIGITPGAASLNDGFPPLTFTPVAAGGIPPAGADFNGILNLLSQTIRWKNAGGQFGYNSAFANDTNVGGYPKGALLLKSGGNGFWLCTADNNTTNPDSGGANWVDPFAGRYLGSQNIVSSGTYTPGTYNGVTATKARFRGAAPGGAGGGGVATSSGQASAGAGGNAGNPFEFWVVSGLAAMTITMGAPGTGVLASAGNAGGDIIIGSIAVIKGGKGGGAGGVVGSFPTFNSLNNTQNAASTIASAAGMTLAGIFNGIGQMGDIATLMSISSIRPGPGGFAYGGSSPSGVVGVTSGFSIGGVGALNTGASSGSTGNTGGSGYLIIDEYA